MCVKRMDGGRKAQSQEAAASGGADVEMADEFSSSEAQDDQQHSGEQWSLYCTLSPLGERLLMIRVWRIMPA